MIAPTFSFCETELPFGNVAYGNCLFSLITYSVKQTATY